jgi:DNA-binding response OmpR family regulator
MSNFVTLLVEDDALQREVLADVLKDEGFEVIECTTAESAELIIASTGTELHALITDHNLAGKMSGAELRVSERMCKQVSVSLPYRGDSHDDRHDDYT